MKELSLHILDLVQNSVNAGADTIQILIAENTKLNTLEIKIIDNGKGMTAHELEQVNDPFYTTGNKKTGLGIPLIKQHAEAAGGGVTIKSAPGKGTSVIASFTHNHIDRQPMGDIASTIHGLIRSFPNINIIYRHSFNKNHFTIDTSEIKAELGEIPINSKEIIDFIHEMIEENLKEIME